MSALILFVYIAIPVLEIATIVWMVSLIGGWWTIAALLGCSLVGAVLVTRAGRGALDALRAAAVERRPPDKRLANAGLVFLGGMLLLVPGFLTSLAGAVLALPLSWPWTRRWLSWALQRRAARYAAARGRAAPFGAFRPGGPGGTPGAGGRGGGTVITGDVVSSRDSRSTGITGDEERSSGSSGSSGSPEP